MQDDVPSSRGSDLTGALMGLGALGLMIGSPWLVDTSGPVPFYKGPLIFPLIALGLIVLASVPACIRLVWQHGVWEGHFSVHPTKGAGVFLLLCFFPYAMLLAGPEAATWLFLLAGFRLAGYRNFKVALVTATLVAIIVYVAFRQVLGVWFPEPILLSLVTGD